MKLKYTIRKEEPEAKKKELYAVIAKTFGDKATVKNDEVQVDGREEQKIIRVLLESGVRFQKAA